MNVQENRNIFQHDVSNTILIASNCINKKISSSLDDLKKHCLTLVIVIRKKRFRREPQSQHVSCANAEGTRTTVAIASFVDVIGFSYKL